MPVALNMVHPVYDRTNLVVFSLHLRASIFAQTMAFENRSFSFVFCNRPNVQKIHHYDHSNVCCHAQSSILERFEQITSCRFSHHDVRLKYHTRSAFWCNSTWESFQMEISACDELINDHNNPKTNVA